MLLRATLLAALGLFALPAGAQHDTGVVTLDVNADGTLGQNLGVGAGFTFEGANGLFEGQLMVGISEDQMSGQAYAADANTPPSDWVEIAGPTALTPPFPAPFDVFDQGFEATFTDAAAPMPLGISVRQRTYSSTDAARAGFVVVEYEVANTTADELSPMHIGFFADWDVNAATANQGGFVEDPNMIYVFDTAGATDYFGTALLGNAAASGFSLEVGDGANPVDGQMFIALTTPGGTPAAPDDLRTVIGTGPFTVAGGGTATVLLALVAGNDLDELVASAQAANALFPVADEESPSLGADRLSAPRPNPATGSARIAVSLDAAESVRVSVYDVLGREVAVVHQGALAAGSTELTIALDGVAPGLYMVRAEGESFRATRTLTLTR